MTDNDRFDDMLRDAAQSYNAPPQTPREAMWDAVRQRRPEQVGSAAGPQAASVLESNDKKITPLRRPQRDWLRWSTGIAATLLIGFGLGKWQGADRGDVAGHSQRGQAAEQGTVASALPKNAGSPPAREAEAAAGGRSPQPGDDPAAAMRERATPSAYQVAAVQHLTQMEVLLTSFRAEAEGGRVMDDQLSVWATDLLGTTRLLLDSPAGDDQRLKRLLKDLELVLAQIAQLGSRRAGQEVEMINEAVEWRNVLPRLRSAIPAGSVPAGI